MRLIDADKFKEYLVKDMEKGLKETYPSGMIPEIVAERLETMYKSFLLSIDIQSTIDPIKYGKWIYNPNANDWGIGGWCCSECGYKNDILGTSEKLSKPIGFFAGTHYCACCGAKMNKED